MDKKATCESFCFNNTQGSKKSYRNWIPPGQAVSNSRYAFLQVFLCIVVDSSFRSDNSASVYCCLKILEVVAVDRRGRRVLGTSPGLNLVI